MWEAQTPSGQLTLMRTPVVKRHTTPRSGVFAFFPPCRSWCRHPLATCADLVSLGWCGAHGLPQTLLEGRAPSPWRWPRAGVGSRRPSNISVPSYRPLQKRGYLSLCASEVQGRVRGSTRPPSGTSTSGTGARGGVQSHAQGQGKVPRCSWAFGDALRASGQSTRARLSPSCPSSAAGSPPPLPSRWRKVARSNTTARFNIE